MATTKVDFTLCPDKKDMSFRPREGWKRGMHEMCKPYFDEDGGVEMLNDGLLDREVRRLFENERLGAWYFDGYLYPNKKEVIKAMQAAVEAAGAPYASHTPDDEGEILLEAVRVERNPWVDPDDIWSPERILRVYWVCVKPGRGVTYADCRRVRERWEV